jgi:nitric oxide reductase large subunit
MSEQSNSPTLLVIAAFGLALVGTALGFGAYNKIDDLALGLARVEMVGAAVTRKNLDAAHERIVGLETRVASLEAQLAAAQAAPPAEE